MVLILLQVKHGGDSQAVRDGQYLVADLVVGDVPVVMQGNRVAVI
jgi:hypothetical protein